jgi:predicted MFS family arabinose efflux permease
MRSPRTMLSGYLRRYPLSDRAAFVYDGRAAACFGLFQGLALTLVGVVGRKLGMGSGMLALLMASQFVGFLLNLWFGHLTREGDLRAFVFWPGLLSRAAVALVAFVDSPAAFLAVMAFYFIVSTFGGPAYSSLMRLGYSDSSRGKAMGHIRILIQIISALCAAAAGAFLQAWPWGYRLVFPIAAAAGIGSTVLFTRFRPKKAEAAKYRPEAGASFRDSLSILAKDRAFLIYMAIVFVGGFPDKIMIPLEPIRLVDELGAGYGAAGLLLGTVPLAGGVLGYFLLSRVANRADPFLLLLGTVILSSTRFLGFALAGSPIHLVPGSFLNGIANAGWDLLPLFTILRFADASRLGLYMGLYNTLIGIRGLAGPALGTWLYEGASLRIAGIYWIAFAIELAGAVLLWLFWAARKAGPAFRRSAT